MQLADLVPQPPAQPALLGPGANRRGQRVQDRLVALLHEPGVVPGVRRAHEPGVGVAVVALQRGLRAAGGEGKGRRTNDQVAHHEGCHAHEDAGRQRRHPAQPTAPGCLRQQQHCGAEHHQQQAGGTQQEAHRQNCAGAQRQAPSRSIPQPQQQQHADQGQRGVERRPQQHRVQHDRGREHRRQARRKQAGTRVHQQRCDAEHQVDGQNAQQHLEHKQRHAAPGQPVAQRQQVGVERGLVVDLLATPPALECRERRDVLHPVHVGVVGVPAEHVAVGDLLGPHREGADVRGLHQLFWMRQR